MGFVDQPPFFCLLVWTIQQIYLFGDSILLSDLFLPLHQVSQLYFMSMVNKLGGKTFSTVSRISCRYTRSLFIWGMNSYYSMNCLDISFLGNCILSYNALPGQTTVKCLTGYCLALSVLGLLNKIGFSGFPTGLFTGLFNFARQKKTVYFKPYIGAFIALLIFLRFVIWNFQNDFAHALIYQCSFGENIRNQLYGFYLGTVSEYGLVAF